MDMQTLIEERLAAGVMAKRAEVTYNESEQFPEGSRPTLEARIMNRLRWLCYGPLSYDGPTNGDLAVMTQDIIKVIRDEK